MLNNMFYTAVWGFRYAEIYLIVNLCYTFDGKQGGILNYVCILLSI